MTSQAFGAGYRPKYQMRTIIDEIAYCPHPMQCFLSPEPVNYRKSCCDAVYRGGKGEKGGGSLAVGHIAWALCMESIQCPCSINNNEISAVGASAPSRTGDAAMADILEEAVDVTALEQGNAQGLAELDRGGSVAAA